MSKISIVTINLNNETGLRKTIESVVGQSFRDFELIVIDGDSKDGSKQVIEQYQDQIQYWVSEKDNGIYHAMNKGIVKASGAFLLFLNSGDLLVDEETLGRVSPFLDGRYELVYGQSVMHDGTNNYVRDPSQEMRFSDFVSRKGPHHQSSFIKAELFREIGLYNETLKILSDWEFFLKIIFKHGKNIKYLPFTVCCFDLQGLSSNKDNRQILLSEKERIILENYPRFAEDYKELVFYRKLINNSRIVKAYFKYFKRFKP